MKRRRIKTFFELLTEAVNYYVDNGWDTEKSLLNWCNRLRTAAQRETKDTGLAKKHLTAIYSRLVIDGGAFKHTPPEIMKTINLQRIKPEFRAELDRRIFASSQLIKINREQAIEKTLQRFQGWVSSVPPGGSNVQDKVAEKQAIKKSLQQQSYVERRVAIDQGHKLASNVQYILALQTNAIAFEWHSDWRRPGYDYRPQHKARDERIYLIRDNWASAKGLIKPVNGYYDEITAAGEEPFCSCKAFPIYFPQQLPSEFLTEKGKNELNRT